MDRCDLVASDREVVSGTPVLQGTRIPADTLIANVESFMELDGLSEHDAILATLEAFPSIPGGQVTVHQLLDYCSSTVQQAES